MRSLISEPVVTSPLFYLDSLLLLKFLPLIENWEENKKKIESITRAHKEVI